MLITFRKKRKNGQKILFGNYNFKEVQEFKYLLGSILSVDNDKMKDVLKVANRGYYALLPVIKFKDVHRSTKIMLYKTLIRSVITYGCETWAITRRITDNLDTFERKILRRLYRPV